MKILLIILTVVVVGLWLATNYIARNIEQEFPPIGKFASTQHGNLHYVDTGTVEGSEKPALMFIHGASSNLRDQMAVYRPILEKDYRLIFPDRPGHGYSDAFSGSYDPKEQAAALAQLLDEIGVEKAVITAHSFGGVVAAAFAVLYPEKTAGLVLLAPVAYPWGTGVDWHYDAGNLPVIGWLFSNLIAIPAGNQIYPNAIKRVFLPNEMPSDYAETSGTKLALRPRTFRANAMDVARVADHVEVFHPRYKEIKVPMYIFHGDQDKTVSLEIHSINGLSKDVEGSVLEILEGVGHKPDYVARDKVVDAIEKITSQSSN